MMPTRQGSLKLFQFAGIDVYVHWSWFIFAVFETGDPMHRYSNLLWNALEYLSLFALVLLHEFGHALACRQVGGRADQIVLWPLGGVAYVDPPQRPGATLWSIAAGPLVNVILTPVFYGLCILSQFLGWADSFPNLNNLFIWVLKINVGLLCFNLLPIYPLDGGQIFRSLLWFFFGRGRSLMIAAIFGFIIAGAGVVLLLITGSDVWLLIMAAFILFNCWRGFQVARALSRLDAVPRHPNFQCPACHAAPPVGAIWMCGQCRQPFDAFTTFAVCPHCGAQFGTARCVECGGMFPMGAWTPPQQPPITESRV